MLSPFIRDGFADTAPVEPRFAHQLLRESTPTQSASAGFAYRILVPRSSALVRVHGFAPVVVGPCSALFLGPDDRIDRSSLSDELFVADSVQLPRSLVQELSRLGEPRSGHIRGERFPMPWARLSPDQYLGLRLVLRAEADALERESALATWVQWVLRSAAADWRKRPVPAQSLTLQPSDRSRFALAQQMAAHIETHWRRNVSLTELAEAFGLSSFHLLRAFRRAMALTPHQYLLHLRLRRSLDMIEGGRNRIVDAAIALGFCSHGHFSTAFRNVFGMTPIEFGGYRRCQSGHSARISSPAA